MGGLAGQAWVTIVDCYAMGWFQGFVFVKAYELDFVWNVNSFFKKYLRLSKVFIVKA